GRGFRAALRRGSRAGRPVRSRGRPPAAVAKLVLSDPCAHGRGCESGYNRFRVMAPNLFPSEHLADAQAQVDRLIAAHKPGRALLACGGMDRDDDLDRSEFGLHPAHVREVAGLIFVCLAEDPIAFEGAEQSFAAMLKPQGLERAKVAAVRSYEVNANWKLVWE